ncbi:MAG: CPBP family intramembrane metalloprotease [Candidatus Omnitrophica bacterium]|nr:CPBP family intramembrane metalloprotease [Candidatus Omnitrophota bacterium]
MASLKTRAVFLSWVTMREIDFARPKRWIWDRRLYLAMALLTVIMRWPFSSSPQPAETESVHLTQVYEQLNESFKEQLKKPENLVLLTGATLLMFGALAVGLLLFFTWGVGFLKKRIPEPSPVPWELWDLVRVLILSFFWGQLSFIGGLAVLRLAKMGPLDQHFLMLAGTLWFDLVVFICILYVVLRRSKGTVEHLGLNKRSLLTNIKVGILGYLSSLPILLITLLLVLGAAHLLKYEPPPQPVQEIFLTEKNGRVVLFGIVLVSVLGPFFEELFFRGLLYNALRKRMGSMTALWLNSSLFAAVHANLFGFLPILVLGALLTLLYQKTGSLAAPITVHVLHNSLMVGFLFLIKQVGGL